MFAFTPAMLLLARSYFPTYFMPRGSFCCCGGPSFLTIVVVIIVVVLLTQKKK